MKKSKNRVFFTLLIFMVLLATKNMNGQQPTLPHLHHIDSIFENTIHYIVIKDTLIKYHIDLKSKEEHLSCLVDSILSKKDSLTLQKEAIEKELFAIKNCMDSLLPSLIQDNPRPKENFINLLSKKFSGNFGININQLSLSNWAAGGESSSTGKAFANIVFASTKGMLDYKSQGSFAFGISRFIDKRIEKSDDKIDITTSVTKVNSNQLKFSMVSTFSTQFADGYSYPNDSVKISGFFAPAYLTLSSGYTYKNKNGFLQVYLSPIAGKVTFVTIQELADKGSFGVTPAHYDEDSVWIKGQNVLGALGANIIFNYSQKIGQNIAIASACNCYYNYSEKRDDKRLKLDVNWETTANFIINKRVTTMLFVHLKYDHNTTFPVYAEIDGTETLVKNIPKLQFKESLGIAFTYSFN
jgi:Protein of unknown function (DUF3078).